MNDGISLDEIVELDEAAAPEINGERARQQAEFHAREVREHLAAYGFRTFEEAVGHAELIDPEPARRARERELLRNGVKKDEQIQAHMWTLVELRFGLLLGKRHARTGHVLLLTPI